MRVAKPISPISSHRSQTRPRFGLRRSWGVLRSSEPVALLALTRQTVPVFDRSRYAEASGTLKGAYVVSREPSSGPPAIILIATGSETRLAVETASPQGRLEGVGDSGAVIGVDGVAAKAMQLVADKRQ
jgi:hypothetical protein